MEHIGFRLAVLGVAYEGRCRHHKNDLKVRFPGASLIGPPKMHELTGARVILNAEFVDQATANRRR